MTGGRGRLAAAGALVTTLAVATSGPLDAQGLALSLQTFATGLSRPTVVTDPEDGTDRLFIVQQTGEILIWDGTEILEDPFLDLSAAVTCCSELGLLGLAFHPDYATNGFFYVNYSDLNGDSVVSRFSVSAGDPDLADAGSELQLLAFAQPETNHNGGHMSFGPDGYLYISSGDGGPGGDPNNEGQSLDTLLGKILRIDVDGGSRGGLPYGIPGDNPFVGVPGAREEIWAYGLRNPWKHSFDRQTGDLWIGDVGQGSWEEIDFQAAASAGGENYGWRTMEGSSCFSPAVGCDMTGLTLPVLEYSHSFGCSVTAGYRYRGTLYPQLQGVYLYGDYCTGTIWGTVPSCTPGFTSRVVLESGQTLTTFGEDHDGELYTVDYSSSGASVQRIGLAVSSDGPEAAPDPASLDFGGKLVGTLETRGLEISNPNPGPEAALVASIAVSDPVRFTLDLGAGANPCLTTTPCLAAGLSCTLEVTFSSATAGEFDETLTVEGNFATLDVPLMATAADPCPHAPSVTVESQQIDDAQQFFACQTITGGPALELQTGADVLLEAGTSVTLVDGVTVEQGADLTVSIDPLLAL